jgi:nucleotide-binding universal stress UspA family protein
MYRTLMVPLDGSAFGEHALPLALMIARRSGATVNLVHVAVPPTPYDLGHLLRPDGDDISVRARGWLYLDQLAEHLAPYWEVPITTTVLEGDVVPALEAHALKSGADLVVMTTHGRGGLRRLALGSVADEMVRSLPLPVLLTRPREGALDLLDQGPEEPYRRMLLPLDGSALAESALEPALALGGLFGAEYTLLHAINPPMLGYALAAHAADIDQETLDLLREEAQAYLGKVAARLRKRGLQVTTDIVLGYPAKAILAYARGHGCELIALATHGQGGISRLLLGSTADEVVRGAGVPVVVSRPAAAIVVQEERAAHEAIEQIPV